MLAACTRRFSSMVSNGASASRATSSNTSVSKKLVKAKVSSVSGVGTKSLAAMAMRKYAEAATPNTDAAVKKWNLELNKLLKLRYYEEGVAHYEKMKAAGVTPNATTFTIMFDTYLAWNDDNAIVGLLEDIKARGLKTFFIEHDTKLRDLLQDPEDPIARKKAVDVHSTILRYRKANINLFEAPK